MGRGWYSAGETRVWGTAGVWAPMMGARAGASKTNRRPRRRLFWYELDLLFFLTFPLVKQPHVEAVQEHQRLEVTVPRGVRQRAPPPAHDPDDTAPNVEQTPRGVRRFQKKSWDGSDGQPVVEIKRSHRVFFLAHTVA